MLQAVLVPESVAAAQAALRSRPRSILLAGGTSVMPEFNYGTDGFDTLVSLRKAGLSGISIADGKATIGAATALADIQDRAELGFLWGAIDTIGSPTVRNMATVGGNLFVEQPYGDFAVCLVALGATATIVGAGGTRIEPVETLVRDGVARDEIVSQISFSLPPAGLFRFTKVTRKAFNSASIVTVAAVVRLDADTVVDCSIALGGVAKRPVRAAAVERALKGQKFDRETVAKAAEAAAADIEPATDAYASAWYRARVTPVHIRRALLGE